MSSSILNPCAALVRLIDGPLVIVLCTVVAVLLTIQLGAVSFLAPSQVDHAAQREAAHRVAVAACKAADATPLGSVCVSRAVLR